MRYRVRCFLRFGGPVPGDQRRSSLRPQHFIALPAQGPGVSEHHRLALECAERFWARPGVRQGVQPDFRQGRRPGVQPGVREFRACSRASGKAADKACSRASGSSVWNGVWPGC